MTTAADRAGHTSSATDAWRLPSESRLAALVEDKSRQCLAAYRENPSLVEQDANIEISNVEGGYGRKQLNELVQNAADALVGKRGRVALVLTDQALYCANEGAPLSADGIDALMHSHLSIKRDEQIGRFGLGFKSVLGISDRPEIFSRTVSLRFDRQRASREILRVKPSANRTPVLRLAEVIDPFAEAHIDPQLTELLDWATTVVRLPLRDHVTWLQDEIREFPNELLLFAPQVRRLDVRMPGRKRSWSALRHGSRIEIRSEDGGVDAWTGFTMTHRPSDAALRDAGQISGREEVLMSWMVPDKLRTRRGRFWAYFPTQSQTSLSGIVNAAFKTNEDRHDLLKGVYNRELMLSTLPRLVSEHLQELVNPEDPGSVLDILPARGREAAGWADDEINKPVTDTVARWPCLPDLDGVLRKPSDIKVPPLVVCEHPSWLDIWTAIEGRPVHWLHPSVLRSSERRAKADRLKETAGGRASSVAEWLLDLSRGGTVECARGVIILAAAIDKHELDHMKAVQDASLVLAGDGSFRRLIHGQVFLPDSVEDTGPEFVHWDLASDQQTRSALTELGIGLLDPLGKLGRQVAEVARRRNLADVLRMWELSRVVPPADAGRVMEATFGAGGVPVITVSNRVALLGEVLLAGPIIPVDGSRDTDHVVNQEAHEEDAALLDELGAVAEPKVGSPDEKEKSFREWRAAAVVAYVSHAASKGKSIAMDQVKPVVGSRAINRVDLLPRLTIKGRLAFTEAALRNRLAPWPITGSPQSVVDLAFTNPSIWWLTQHGAIETSYGPQSPNRVFVESAAVPSNLLPAVSATSAAGRHLGLKSAPSREDWTWIFPLAESTLNCRQLHELYGLSASAGAQPPRHLVIEGVVRTSRVTPDLCAATSDAGDYDALREMGHHAVLTRNDDEASALIGHWGLTDGRHLINRSVLSAVSGEPRLLVDHFPGLRTTGLQLDGTVELVPCSEITVFFEGRSEGSVTLDDEPVAAADNKLYYLDVLDDNDLLGNLNSTLRWGLSDGQMSDVLADNERRFRNNVRLQAKQAANVGDKLVALAGQDAVRELVNPRAVALIERMTKRSLTTREIADMAVKSYGASQVLRMLSSDIEENGLQTPARLAGESTSLSWVQELGLPEEFAGVKEDRPPARESIMGPIVLPPLHIYQRTAIDNVTQLLSGTGPHRGLVSLPTGSGKTRVAVQAVVEHITSSRTTPLVLWIAQSDELCEQAAETWGHIWRSIGSPKESLTLSRFWGSNDAVPPDTGVHLVIATDDKLESARVRASHEWLRAADIVIVDEAHTSVSKTYTSLFTWLGRGTTSRERPLIGLTATPYRGTDLDQTRQLVGRYDRNHLTQGIFGDVDEHRYLQELGVLARVRHAELPGSQLRKRPVSGIAQRPQGRRDIAEFSVDLNAVAADATRNRHIIDSLLTLPKETTVLLFAASVEHGQVLAQVLNQQGIAAASVSADTPTGQRRALVRKLKDGEIRVLTNYNVLSQGFDAPKVGAVYVTRPTFSLNRYQQMIGRGLRGKKNGGSEEVLIVNVKDNVNAFGEKLAFHHFDALWSRGR